MMPWFNYDSASGNEATNLQSQINMTCTSDDKFKCDLNRYSYFTSYSFIL